jgi:hypothetical protein
MDECCRVQCRFNTEVMQSLRKYFFEDCSRRKWLEDCAVHTWQHASIQRNLWDKEYENCEWRLEGWNWERRFMFLQRYGCVYMRNSYGSY